MPDWGVSLLVPRGALEPGYLEEVFEMVYFVFAMVYFVFEMVYFGFAMVYFVFEMVYFVFGMVYFVGHSPLHHDQPDPQVFLAVLLQPQDLPTLGPRQTRLSPVVLAGPPRLAFRWRQFLVLDYIE